MNSWYVLYVRTGSEEKVTRFLKQNLNTENHLPFVPMKSLLFRRQGIINKETKICFSGYVFIQSSMFAIDFINEVYPIVRRLKAAYFFLNYGEKFNITMREEEKLLLMSLLGNDFCIENSIGFSQGDIVKVVSGALIGMESRIKKINRHKREAIVEVEMMGSIRRVTVALEIVAKV